MEERMQQLRTRRRQAARRRKRRVLILSAAVLLALAVGGTLAYIATETYMLKNSFDPAQVSCKVNQKIGGAYNVTNTSDIPAYIRAYAVVNWMDEEGNVRGIAPKGSEYELSFNDADWQQDAETGYHYYLQPVAPGADTENLITGFGLAQGAKAPEGYALCVEVIAEAIQAAGDTDDGSVPAIVDAWGATPIRGS